MAAALGVLLVLAVLSSLGAAIWDARQQAIGEWRAQLNNLSLVLAEQTSQEFNAASLVLDSIAESVQASGIRTPGQLRAKMGTLEHFNSMRDKTRGLPQIDVATIIDANGDLLNSTRSYPAAKITVADRDYFQQHLKNPALGLYISAPVRNKGNGQWTFYLSRRLNGPHGEFLGLALAGFSSAFLSDFYKKITLGGGATITLYRRDFTVLARWPHIDQLIGQVNRTGSSYQVIEQMGKTHDVLLTSSRRFSQSFQAVARMGAPRLIDKYPLIINVTVTEALYLAQWRRYTAVLALVAGFSVLAIVAAFMVLVRSLMRREKDMEETRNLKTVAEAANRAKSEFLAMMSHEIRTPLTSIIGFAELMAIPHSSAAASDAGAVILRNGNHLLDIINDILDISKIEAGRLHLEHLPFSPLELVHGVQAMMSAQAASKGIVFAVQVAYPFPAKVMGDPTRWKQILFNLCSNAIKFTELGTVQLTLRYDQERGKLVCKVADTGIGISEAQRDLLFQPFSQADSSVARKFGGTGLGLHLVDQLAARMGGRVAVASELGRGSVFEVDADAPVAGGSAWLAEAPPMVDQPALPDPFALRLRGHVLLAEDGPDNRMLIGAFLKGIGVSYEMAEDGAQAVELARRGGFDVVLMDIQMPVMDGARAAQILRASGFGQPIIALTANVMPEDVQRYLRAGCSHCVGKPINFGELGSVMAELLGQPVSAAARPPAAVELDGYEPIRRAFEQSLPERLFRLAQQLRADAWLDARQLAHTLKGSAGSFGFPGVTRVAAEIERAASRADREQARAALARLLALEELGHLPKLPALHAEQ